MSTFEETRIIRLPATGAAPLYEHVGRKEEGEIAKVICSRDPEFGPKNLEWQGQHLYFLVDEEVKEGQWYFDEDKMKIKLNAGENLIKERTSQFPLVGSTDKSLRIAEPPQDFINLYCDNNGIENVEVLIEYERKDIMKKTRLTGYEFLDGVEWIPKVSPENTLTIRIVKDKWTTNEVKELLKSYREDHEKTGGNLDLDEWFNLKI